MQARIITHFSLVAAIFHAGVWQRLYASLRTHLLRETYALPLDLLRIVGGLLCVAYFLRLLVEAEDFSNPDGVLDHVLLHHIFWFTRLSLWQPGITLPWFYSIFGLACGIAWGIVLGYRVRLCAGVLFVIAVSTYRWNFIVIYVDDAFMHLLLFWLMLLPVGHTLLPWELRQGWRSCWQRWCQKTVPGTVQWCFLANICLLYVVAGLWKLASPLWQQGFALYAILRLPIAHHHDMWGPQHLPFLQVGNYLTMLIEPLLPFLLLCRPGHPAKWCGLLCHVGFHLGIVLTLNIPFVNFGLLATALLFFREEIMGWLQREGKPALQQAPHYGSSGVLALIFLLVLSLAVVHHIPFIGGLYKPAYALLWMAGITQEYQLFNWIDKTNYHVTYRINTQTADGTIRIINPQTFFPSSLRGTLLQMYLHNIRWMPVPIPYRQPLMQSIMTRLGQRFCRQQNLATPVTVSAHVQRIRPDNLTLTEEDERFLMHFRCAAQQLILCRTFLYVTNAAGCLAANEISPEHGRFE
ncbi:MAG: hypothetical protein FJZ47_00820 [Candidatus Tectomicrobia bacterium]|uniref:HTTM-like domain-containing protein n=1 Tax=Tectimicrobiota bacterium TaxID=2528274 RepID=A0A937VY70_UNCTE|nr:hypothetical protein [Candidatus Tectomicrobia bacterium]